MLTQSINLNFIRCKRGEQSEKRSLSEALNLCKNAGFLKLDYLSDLQTDDFLDRAKAERKLINKLGMSVTQSHCPFFRYGPNGLDKFKVFAPRAVKAAAALGAKYLVIHADEYFSADPEETLKKTKEYLAAVVELCVQNNIRPAIENLFEDGYGSPKGQRSRYTAEAEEVLAVIESFPGSGIGCCWDSGHHNVSFGQENFLKKLELLAPYIICTHIHDNSYSIDMHKPALFGTIEWEKVMPILKKAGYNGELSWEFVYERIPDSLYPDYLAFVKKIGDWLCSL